MGAPKGNEFWKQRSKHGRNPIFAKSEELWEACQEYFQWVEDNPLWESKVASSKGEPVIMSLPKMRAMTIHGLCIFLDIDQTTWKEYGKKEDFSRVVTRTEEIIYSQKFTGAAADMLNANIIARDLGLRDRQEISGELEINNLSDEQIDAKLAALLAKSQAEKQP